MEKLPSKTSEEKEEKEESKQVPSNARNWADAISPARRQIMKIMKIREMKEWMMTLVDGWNLEAPLLDVVGMPNGGGGQLCQCLAKGVLDWSQLLSNGPDRPTRVIN